MKKTIKLKDRYSIDRWLIDYCIKYYSPDETGYLSEYANIISLLELINYDLKEKKVLYEISNAYSCETESHNIYLIFTPDNEWDELLGLCSLQDIKKYNNTGYEICLEININDVDEDELRKIDINKLM